MKDNSTDAQLQYNGTWITGLNVAKINYYGNQTGLWIGLKNTADAAHTNSIEFSSKSLFICSAKVYYLSYFKQFLIKICFLNMIFLYNPQIAFAHHFTAFLGSSICLFFDNIKKLI